MPLKYVDGPDLTIYVGDIRDQLAQLKDGSVDCVITSPPYWGLRDYSVDGQLGLEATPDEYVTNMVAVFREIRRVLAGHGTCWVNLGDSYTAGMGSRNGLNASGLKRNVRDEEQRQRCLDENKVYRSEPVPGLSTGLKPKDLVGVPWRVAFALQQDGWYLRADVIWAKPNPMPESVTDRPTKSHEYVFLLSKRPRYFFDQEAVREPHAELDRPQSERRRAQRMGRSVASVNGLGQSSKGIDGGMVEAEHFMQTNPAGRNVRSVWEIATQPYPEAHFATYPEELVRRCILAGCPVRVCGVCGKPSERIVERETNWPERREAGAWAGNVGVAENYQNNVHGKGMSHDLGGGAVKALGWSDCGHNTWKPGAVLDPFLGSGTTALVARKHGRRCVGIELNPAYAELAWQRNAQQTIWAEAL